MNLRASSRARRCEEIRRRTVFDQPAAMQQHDIAGEAFGLAEIVGRHHHLDAARADGADDVLDRLGGGRIEAGGRLVEKQHGRVARQRARQRQPLLLAARKPARRTPPRPSRPTSASSSSARLARWSRGTSGRGQRVADIAGGAAPQHGRALEHDGAPRRRRRLRSAPGDASARGGISPMAARSSVVLPAPFGPIRTVGCPGKMSSDTRSRIVTSPARTPTSEQTIGRSEAGARMFIPRSVRRRGARPRPAR